MLDWFTVTFYHHRAGEIPDNPQNNTINDDKYPVNYLVN